MSLEAALDDERKQIIDILERQKRRESGARGRSVSPNSGGPHSRGVSRGRSSRSHSRNPNPKENKWSITVHDPSERLVSKDDDKDESTENDESSSEEEQMSDTDSEIDEDEGVILPNFASYTEPSSIPADRRVTKETNASKCVNNAKRAEELDQLSAAERGVANARLIGSEVPQELIDKIEAKAEKYGARLSHDKYYQDDKERKEKLKEYAVYKKKLVSPGGPGLSGTDEEFHVPYTADVEERADGELARTLNETVEIDDIDSDASNARAIRSLTRGRFFELVKEEQHPKTFLLCTDFSEESRYALEWCVGTILVDGSVLYMLNVLEDDEYSSMHLNGIPSQNYHSGSMLEPLAPSGSKPPEDTTPTTSASKRAELNEQMRIDNIERMTRETLELLKLTKLQVHVVFESIHHPIPRHFIVEVIRHLSPSLVIVGSKGTSALKGVLLGSLSNYLVRKSTVPVMVVKRKLKKLIKKKGAGKFNNNIKPLHTLAEARID
ncbi:hypothetical protein LJB42_002714 [Komagataella kurtzmanii]|nr:hypothetical protein LJB42_002714 [Komagataella kurtzmanii]